MDITNELKGSDVVLLILAKEHYKAEIASLARSAESMSKKVCYVCINEPYGFVSANRKKSEAALEMFFFIDALTMRVQEPPLAGNCIFVSSPNALTEISLAL